jgi:hypothetical protein
MLSKTLRGFPRSVQEVGFLRDGTLYLDSHVFSDKYDYADTDYLAASDVTRLKAIFCRSGLKAQSDAELLDIFAARYDTALDARTALHALGFRPVHITDIDARYSRRQEMPTAA